MLTRLDLEHFKCFERLKLPLGSMTLLAGTNAAGKSSILQAMVLLHQTMKLNEWSTHLLLNGDELQLGTVQDIVDKVHGRLGFRLGLVDEDRVVEWTFRTDERQAMSADVAAVTINGARHDAPLRLHFLLPPDDDKATQLLAKRMSGLSYLSAERVGPRDVYSLADPLTTQVVGSRGEHTTSLLHWARDEAVSASLVRQGHPPRLLAQVSARMDQFFPGCSIDVQRILSTNGVSLGIRTSNETDFHRPVHVGFGLTQVLPVIVAAMSSTPGDLLLVENPEVHLHPAGQAMMGHFLAEVAAAGTQVILETHSDHVLSGVRRAVKSGATPSECVRLHFFRDRTLGGDQVVSPLIDNEGNIDHWPDGFFDQFDKDMNHFAGWEN
ncbi:MAG: DUF3696 domain-containing protein [Planctomycetota bacterium]